MIMKLRPNPGGFMRPFGCGTFIRDYLLGLGPFGSPEIDSKKGAVTQDIFYHYKVALHTAYAEEAVDRENKRRIKTGIPIYSPEEYAERVDWHLRRLPYKLVKARYHSFSRYFHWLKQLEWVELTGEEERSTMQEVTADHPDAHPRKLYRLTRKGIEATEEDETGAEVHPAKKRDAFPETVYRRPVSPGLPYRTGARGLTQNRPG